MSGPISPHPDDRALRDYENGKLSRRAARPDAGPFDEPTTSHDVP